MKNKFEVNRRVIKKLWLMEMFPPYSDEGWNLLPRKNKGTKQKNKRLYAYQVRMYKTWKYNRNKQWKQ